MKSFKRIIAKEGLIVLGLAVILYFSLLILQNVPVALPKYRLEFANGEICYININPEIRNHPDYNRFLAQAYNPPQKLVDKRIKEFIRTANIQSSLRNSRYINANQVYISERYSYFIGGLFILKLAIVYLVLLLIRFISWAVRKLKG